MITLKKKLENYIGNKYLTQGSTDKNKEVLIKHTDLWDKIKNLIKKINDKPGDYDEKYMKIKVNSSDNLPLDKTLLEFHNIIVIRSVFSRRQQILSKSFLDECLYELLWF